MTISLDRGHLMGNVTTTLPPACRNSVSRALRLDRRLRRRADQNLQNPLGVNGPDLMEWFFHTRIWRQMHGHTDGETGVDNEMAERPSPAFGAWILGRNMFGPVRGPWPDESWKGWWGDEPPYHTPVFVLTHHARPPLTMAGGTEFRFVTDGIDAALEQARAAAGGRDVRVGGGVATIRQYLAAA